MGLPLNQQAWEKLVDEDLEWLDKQARTLERDHIRDVLKWVRRHKPTIPLSTGRDFYEEEQLEKLLPSDPEQTERQPGILDGDD